MDTIQKSFLGCPYCNIASGKENDTVFIYDDAQVCAFQDPNPDSETHFLVLSKVHIHDYNSLTEKDIALLEHMQAIGNKLLDQANQKKLPTKMGFLPTSFSRVNHLHMQCLTLPLKCNWMRKLLYTPFIFFDSHDLVEELKESCYNL
ncbi:HIT-like protein [Basidiobolus meristosporus CBS 931.73]|uniref:HIT-like protein n=1 Tax=Basidiobolus meristosporus CBS 931.73 TaxID=1314790 RepID=A0A1Y1XZQ5_9FUNG|nr:HIT-like protein [Basidiobolus meristosporus CBS 931.73]|eukprot:ORX91222.1 HIT-like protein [Basidiobolus meristosporus CBS 931.73]